MEPVKTVDVLLVIEAEIATTHLVEQILSGLALQGVTYKKRLLVDLIDADFQQTTLPMFVRCADPILTYWVHVLGVRGIPYIYYIDDNFWKIEGESALAKYYQHASVQAALKAVVSHAYRVFTNSAVLAQFIEQFSSQLRVLPPPFSFELIDGIEPERSDEIRIGFAGSPSRVRDLDIVVPIIEPLLQKYSNIVFEFAGVMPDLLVQGPRVRFFPHSSNYTEYIRFQVRRGWAIGLAPLHDTVANRCKTNNKYREYAACNIAGVYTDIPPYTDSVRRQHCGLLVGNEASQWLAAVESLVLSPRLRTEITKAAWGDVYSKYSIEPVGRIWRDALIEASGALSASHRRRIRLQSVPASVRRLDAWWAQVRMQIWLTYEEGGALLVISRSVRRLVRGVVPWWP